MNIDDVSISIVAAPASEYSFLQDVRFFSFSRCMILRTLAITMNLARSVRTAISIIQYDRSSISIFPILDNAPCIVKDAMR